MQEPSSTATSARSGSHGMLPLTSKNAWAPLEAKKGRPSPPAALKVGDEKPAEEDNARDTHESPLPGNYKVGNAVWAAYDLSNDTKLLVRKHCPGRILGRSQSHPTERVLVQFDQSADGANLFKTNVTPSMILGREPPLPGNHKVGESVWAARDLTSDTKLLVRKHCPGRVLRRSQSHPTERVLVQFDQSADGTCKYECNVLVSQIVAVEPPLPGKYTVGESVWASLDLERGGTRSCPTCCMSVGPHNKFCTSCGTRAVGESAHVSVRAHTHGKVLGRSSSEPSERVLVEFDKSADGVRSCRCLVEPECEVTSSLPGNYKVGNTVWAAYDLSNDTELLVRKHCPGRILGLSQSHPTERVLVQFDQSADGANLFKTDVTPSMILGREPPLPGNYKVGESVWATRDLKSGGDAPRLIVCAHIQGRVLGRSSWQPSSRVSVEFDTGASTHVQPEHHVTTESPFSKLGVMTLYHMTTEANAQSIIRSGFCCSRRGMFGPFVYFARSPSECEGKAHSSGAVLCARVDLGTALVCKTAQSDLAAEKLSELGCQSVMGTAPAVSRDEFAVPSSSQISKIRLGGYKVEDGVQPWWAWPAWVHQLGSQIGFDDDEIEKSTAVGQGPRINSAGRPIHDNGRFMSYVEARKLGWSGTSVKPNLHAKGRKQESAGSPTFYKGGQFMPGGGRAPAGGCYHSQSVDGAPKGGCMVSSGGYPDKGYSIGGGACSGGGGTFYKGGQFIPGGGRAPKGGCRA